MLHPHCGFETTVNYDPVYVGTRGLRLALERHACKGLDGLWYLLDVARAAR
jgi:hypothetical protein